MTGSRLKSQERRLFFPNRRCDMIVDRPDHKIDLDAHWNELVFLDSGLVLVAVRQSTRNLLKQLPRHSGHSRRKDDVAAIQIA